MCVGVQANSFRNMLVLTAIGTQLKLSGGGRGGPSRGTELGQIGGTVRWVSVMHSIL